MSNTQVSAQKPSPHPKARVANLDFVFGSEMMVKESTSVDEKVGTGAALFHPPSQGKEELGLVDDLSVKHLVGKPHDGWDWVSDGCPLLVCLHGWECGKMARCSSRPQQRSVGDFATVTVAAQATAGDFW